MLTIDERCRNNLIHNNYIICQKKEADIEQYRRQTYLQVKRNKK